MGGRREHRPRPLARRRPLGDPDRAAAGRRHVVAGRVDDQHRRVAPLGQDGPGRAPPRGRRAVLERAGAVGRCLDDAAPVHVEGQAQRPVRRLERRQVDHALPRQAIGVRRRFARLLGRRARPVDAEHHPRVVARRGGVRGRPQGELLLRHLRAVVRGYPTEGGRGRRRRSCARRWRSRRRWHGRGRRGRGLARDEHRDGADDQHCPEALRHHATDPNRSGATRQAVAPAAGACPTGGVALSRSARRARPSPRPGTGGGRATPRPPRPRRGPRPRGSPPPTPAAGRRRSARGSRRR